MAKSKDKVRYRYRDRTNKFRRHSKPSVHLIPAALEVGALALPVFSDTSQGYPSPWESAVRYRNGQAAAENLILNVESEWKDMAILFLGGIAAKYIGKKTGLNRLGTKELKLF
jgi:hypothetical protein